MDSQSNDILRKSVPIMDLCQTSDMPIMALKLIDIWLSKIDPRIPSVRSVVLSPSEVKRILGVSQIRYEYLDAAVSAVLQSTVKMLDPNNPDDPQKGTIINLFEMTSWNRNGSNKCEITLTCTQAAQKFFYNLDSIQFYRYKLKEIIGLNTRRGYLMFMYIVRNSFREEWDVDIFQLRKALDINENDYPDDWRFYQKCIVPVIADVNNKTGYSVKCNTVKKSGNMISCVHIKILEYPTYLISDEQTSLNMFNADDDFDNVYRPLYEYDEDKNKIRQNFGACWHIKNGIKYYDDERLNKSYPAGSQQELMVGLCYDAFKDEFTWEQLFELTEIIMSIPLDFMPTDDDGFKWKSDEESNFFRRFNFSRKLFNNMLEKDKSNTIEDRFAYLKKVFVNKRNTAIAKANDSENTSHDFDINAFIKRTIKETNDY